MTTNSLQGAAIRAFASHADPLRRALEPLVAVLNDAEKSFTKADELFGGPVTDEDAVMVSIGLLRAARSALSSGENNNGE